MKTKKKIVLLMVAIVAVLNFYYVSNKNKTVLKELHLMDILAFAGDENDFPEDPWKDEDSGSSKYEERRVTNRYEYSYTWQYDDNYKEYRIPLTIVACDGLGKGDVSCIPSVTSGDMVYTGIVKEENRKDR